MSKLYTNINSTDIYLVRDAEVELLVARSNNHLGVGKWIIGRARFEYNVAIVQETTY